MTNNDPLYTFNAYYYHAKQYGPDAVTSDIYAGGTYPLFMLHNGTHVEINGESAVIMTSFTKNALVRFHDSQECVTVPVRAEVRVLSYTSWIDAVPRTGTVVVARNGQYQGKAGIIAEPGLNSAHVIFPGTAEVVKMSSKNLIIKPNATITV